MADSRIVAIAITVLAVFGGTLFNNARIGDVKKVLRAEMKAFEAKMDLRFERIEHKLADFLRIVGDHETQIGRLEQRSR